MATQTETQRRVAAQKAATTRKQNEAKRRRSAQKAAETRARAQQSRLKVVGLQAQRVADTAVGAAVSGGEKVAETFKPLRSPDQARREAQRLQRRAAVNLRKVERRGATARQRALRNLRRNRRDAEQHVRSARQDVERRFEDVQSNAESLLQRK
jgi:hypothetical protein